MNRKSWKRLTFHVRLAEQEPVIAVLERVGCRGFLQEDDRLECYLSAGTWTGATRTQLAVLLAGLEASHPGTDVSFDSGTLQEKNWNARWEKSAGLVDATDRIVIKPTWAKLRKKDKGKVIIKIDPKMSFGTGHHESTRLALRLLEEFLHRGDRVLDFGCGSGVLAIACAKLRAKSVVAIDNDAWSYENAVENVKRNGAAATVKVRRGSAELLRPASFDLIVTNIDYPTIVAHLATLRRSMKRPATLILSGLLTDDIPSLHDKLRHSGLMPLAVLGEGAWAALAVAVV